MNYAIRVLQQFFGILVFIAVIAVMLPIALTILVAPIAIYYAAFAPSLMTEPTLGWGIGQVLWLVLLAAAADA